MLVSYKRRGIRTHRSGITEYCPTLAASERDGSNYSSLGTANRSQSRWNVQLIVGLHDDEAFEFAGYVRNEELYFIPEEPDSEDLFKYATDSPRW